MIARRQLDALTLVTRAVTSLLEGQVSWGPEQLRELREALPRVRQLTRQLQAVRTAQDLFERQAEPLTADERDCLNWLYDCAQSWKGGVDPADFAEYDRWLNDARALLVRLLAPPRAPDTPRVAPRRRAAPGAARARRPR